MPLTDVNIGAIDGAVTLPVVQRPVKLLCSACACWENVSGGWGNCVRYAPGRDSSSKKWPSTATTDGCFDGVPSA